jgi:hypothetical protein
MDLVVFSMERTREPEKSRRLESKGGEHQAEDTGGGGAQLT